MPEAGWRGSDEGRRLGRGLVPARGSASPHRSNRRVALIAAGAAGLLLIACSDAPSTLDPRGTRAEIVAELSWVIFALGGAVFLGVLVVFAVALLRGRGAPASPPRPAEGRRLIIAGGIVVPLLILVPLMALTVQTGFLLADPDEPEALTIEVVGRQFWWEVRYPDADVVTANEIHIPAGQPVRLLVTSADVIHSLWVPQLAGKIDLIPHRTNTLWIEADEPGVYRGQCAEFCGIQHAKMAFHVVAEEPEAFAGWLEATRRGVRPPDGELAREGERVFMSLACPSCHAIQGTPADGTAGPDLTHLMDRAWLAGGTLRTTPGNIVAFIVAAQRYKDGSSMPSFHDLDGETLRALIAYLTTLQSSPGAE